jgi:hypothetical protein
MCKGLAHEQYVPVDVSIRMLGKLRVWVISYRQDPGVSAHMIYVNGRILK